KGDDHRITVRIEEEEVKEESEESDEETEEEEEDDLENINGNPALPPDPFILFITEKVSRIKGMHIFIGNFTYVSNFMIVEDISSIIDPRLSQVVLGKPFVEIPNMTHDLSIGVAKFTEGTNEIAYKMPYKIEQYNSLSYLEKEHTKSVYLGNEEDKRRRVDYVMSTILWFYKECLKLGPEYLTVLEDKGEPRKDV
nr:retrotransposon Orf1 [Tanacetum cinerariifolium]